MGCCSVKDMRYDRPGILSCQGHAVRLLWSIVLPRTCINFNDLTIHDDLTVPRWFDNSSVVCIINVGTIPHSTIKWGKVTALVSSLSPAELLSFFHCCLVSSLIWASEGPRRRHLRSMRIFLVGAYLRWSDNKGIDRNTSSQTEPNMLLLRCFNWILGKTQHQLRSSALIAVPVMAA